MQENRNILLRKIGNQRRGLWTDWPGRQIQKGSYFSLFISLIHMIQPLLLRNQSFFFLEHPQQDRVNFLKMQGLKIAGEGDGEPLDVFLKHNETLQNFPPR